MRRYRKHYSEEDWRTLCEDAGKAPIRSEALDVPTEVAVPSGVSPDPPEPLTRLAGMYALTELPLVRLLEVLHPDPEGAGRVLLEAHAEGKRREGGRSSGLRGKPEAWRGWCAAAP